MSTRKRFCLLILLIFLSSVAVVEGPAGPGGGGSGESSDSGGGGGGSSKLTLKKFVKYLEDWEDEKEFDRMKELLWKEPWTTETYIPPAVWLYCPYNNTTISRGDELKIGAYIQDDHNSIDIRRVIHVYLEIKDPNTTNFREVDSQKIQVNDYNEDNGSLISFPAVSSFSYLGKKEHPEDRIGEVQVRVRAADGYNTWYSTTIPWPCDDCAKGWILYIQDDYPQRRYYGERSFVIYNKLPKINNTTMQVEPGQIKWDDSVEFIAFLKDLDGDKVNVTLHVYNNETKINISKQFRAERDETMIIFDNTDVDGGIFKECDAGKNFTYRYSCDDGINIAWTEIGKGPQLKRKSEIKVRDPRVIFKDDDHYWWKNYTFALDVKSLNPEGSSVTVTLFTNTPKNPNESIGSPQTRSVSGDNFTTFRFDSVCFDVLDCNQTFDYRFGYDVPDQDSNDSTPWITGAKISPKLIKYDIYSGAIIVNMLLILAFSLIGGVLIERHLGRGRGG